MTAGNGTFDGAIHLASEGFAKHAGGVRRAAFELLDALRRRNAAVHVARWVDSKPLEPGEPAPSVLRRGLLQGADLMALTRRRIRHRAAVTHSLYYDPSILLAPRPVVVTVYDMIHERFDAGRRSLRFEKRLTVGRADVVVAISQATADDVREFFPNVRDVRVIHLGVARSITDAPLPLSPTRDHLLYVGQRNQYKNFCLLLDALEQSSDLCHLPLVLVGGGPLTLTERARLASLPGRRPIAHHDAVDETTLIDLYDHSLALVVPSICEGFGLPVIEAMTRECPVACSTAPSLVEISQGHSSLFDPHSAGQLADAVRRSISSTVAERRSARLHARQFTWDTVAGHHLDLYRDIMS